jgi:undecaprenyl-diphosphatase
MAGGGVYGCSGADNNHIIFQIKIMNELYKMIIVFCSNYLLFIFIAIAAAYFWKQPRKIKKEMLIFAIILLPLSYLVAKIAGYFYFDPRPFVAGNFTPLIPHSSDNGFPSDHTLLAAAVAATVWQLSKKMGFFLYIGAFLVGLARVLAGVHHFTDILGSILAVWLVYIIVDYCFSKWRGKIAPAHFTE